MSKKVRSKKQKLTDSNVVSKCLNGTRDKAEANPCENPAEQTLKYLLDSWRFQDIFGFSRLSRNFDAGPKFEQSKFEKNSSLLT